MVRYNAHISADGPPIRLLTWGSIWTPSVEAATHVQHRGSNLPVFCREYTTINYYQTLNPNQLYLPCFCTKTGCHHQNSAIQTSSYGPHLLVAFSSLRHPTPNGAISQPLIWSASLPTKICCFCTKKCAWLQVRILSGWWFMPWRSVLTWEALIPLGELWSHTCTRTSHNGQRSELSDKSRESLFLWNEQWSRGL